MIVEVTFDAEGHYAIVYGGQTIAPGPGPLPPPPALFLGSLAACSGLIAVEYLHTQGLPFEGLKVKTEADHAEDPRRLANVRMRIILPFPVEEKHLAPLQRSVDLCTLTNTLAKPPAIIAEVHPRDGSSPPSETSGPSAA
jgi:ribosomal protein S12 methylthiotransferase accessory factor